MSKHVVLISLISQTKKVRFSHLTPHNLLLKVSEKDAMKVKEETVSVIITNCSTDTAALALVWLRCLMNKD